MALQPRLKRRISLFLALAFSLMFALSSTVLALAATSSGNLIKLSSDPYTNKSSQHKTEVEPDTYAFGSTIVSTFQVGRFTTGGSSNIGWATSHDGGKTWKHGFLPGITVYAGGKLARVSDPAVAYDAKHKTWLISTLGLAATYAVILSSSSTDGGLTWNNPVKVYKGGVDKNWIVCDDTASSPYYGNCYSEWDTFVTRELFNLVMMSTSSDGGKHWKIAQNSHSASNGIGGQPLVQPSGTVIVPILGETTKTAFIGAFHSINGGKSWSRMVKAADVFSLLDPGNIRSGPLPTAEVDGAGKVYVAWEDCRFERKCSANDIVMITSTDGVTWSAVQRIPIDPVGSGIDELLPGLGVDKSTSGGHTHLALTYYYFSNVNCTVATCLLNVGFISSTNGGTSWSKKEFVAGPMHMKWLAFAFGYFVGDYISTSFTSDGAAYGVFAVAHPPQGGQFDEAMYTTPEHALQVTGGPITSKGDVVLSTQSPAPVRYTAF